MFLGEKNFIEGNRILGVGVFGYYLDCLFVFLYMFRIICSIYVVYFKIKYCSGLVVLNFVLKNLWVFFK